MTVLNYASPLRHYVPTSSDVGPHCGQAFASLVTQVVGFGVFDPPDGHYKGGNGPKHTGFGVIHLSKSTWSDSDGFGH